MKFELVDWHTHSRETALPRMLLRRDRWDDYGKRITFQTWVVTEDGLHDTGQLKLLQRGANKPDIPRSFEQLDDTFISLGQSFEFYGSLRKLNVIDEVRQALNDLTLFPERRQMFESEQLERNLLRSPSARKILEQRGLLSDPTRNLDVIARFMAFEGDHHLTLSFGDGLDRIGAVVGANGSGKTLLLKVLAGFVPGIKSHASKLPGVAKVEVRKADFTGVVVVSYSPFDPFPFARRRAARSNDPYIYLGLRSTPQTIDIDWAVQRIERAVHDLSARKQKLWKHTLKEAGLLHPEGLLPSDPWNNWEDFKNQMDRAPAGHQVLAMVFTGIIAYAQPGRFILIDEPETHLHPGLLSTFMRLLHQLVDERAIDSHVLLATHSPLVLQELPARMVRIIHVEEKTPRIEPYPDVCFGEDITQILLHAYRQDPTERNYRNLVREVWKKEGTDKVMEALGGRVSLSVRMLLRALEKGLD